jgi:hypothetical protein
MKCSNPGKRVIIAAPGEGCSEGIAVILSGASAAGIAVGGGTVALESGVAAAVSRAHF